MAHMCGNHPEELNNRELLYAKQYEKIYIGYSESIGKRNKSQNCTLCWSINKPCIDMSCIYDVCFLSYIGIYWNFCNVQWKYMNILVIILLLVYEILVLEIG